MNNRPSGHAHHLVKDTAIAMAHELYDTMMQDNQWYAYWQGQYPEMNKRQLEELFVRKNVGKLIGQARATLAQMLATSQDEELKQTIYEALLQDNTLIRGRNN